MAKGPKAQMLMAGEATQPQAVLDDEEQQYKNVVQKVRKQRPDVQRCKQREPN
jgi:hypothetical protein